jgi:dihydrofolate synthase/folylpolyglutamate synthase
MGGRLDSTNIIPASLLSVITGISLDHTAYLGDTATKIAAEKAGIIKKGGTVLFCGNDSAAADVIKKRADEMDARYLTPDRSNFKLNRSDLSGCSFDFGEWKDVELSLLGLYQPENASNVLCAIECLRELGMNIPDEAVREGLKSARWQARFELLSRDPVIIFDGAHNPEGIDAAVRSVKHYFGANKVCILTGVMKDKDYEYIASRLSDVAQRAFTVTPDNPRALGAAEYANTLSRYGIRASHYESVEVAFREARAFAVQNSTPLVCLGSLYMYGEIRECIK